MGDISHYPLFFILYFHIFHNPNGIMIATKRNNDFDFTNLLTLCKANKFSLLSLTRNFTLMSYSYIRIKSKVKRTELLDVCKVILSTFFWKSADFKPKTI